MLPTKARFEYIRRAVKSVLAQTYRDWELLIVDDSDDETHKEVAKLVDVDGRIQLVARDPNIGPCEARRAGVEASQGEFVSFIDSDDYYLPERLEQHMEIWKSHPNIGLSYDSWASLDPEENKYVRKQFGHVPTGFSAPPYTARRMFHGNFIHASSAMTTRKIIDFLGGYPKAPLVCDWFLYAEICARYPVYRIGLPLSIKDSLAPDRLGSQEASFVTSEFLNGKRQLLFAHPRVYARAFLEEALAVLPVALKNRDAQYLRQKLSQIVRTLWS